MTNKAPTPPERNHAKGELPLMATQAIILAAALSLGELLCCPLYAGIVPVAPLPWAAIAILLAVGFSYIVGFALLWCAESFAYRMKRTVQPVVYAVTGAIGFAVWTVWVVLGIVNMITARAGLGVVSHATTVMVGINGALLGMVAFFLAFTLAPRLAKRMKTMVAVAAVTVLLAIAGGVILAMVLQALNA
ncbi:hypothetical protein [Bifidobacterium cuniculi]|uniref:Cd efflux system component n=1 Tax=Bifidobacterium cuniculi TaxID=1688 RepID=A0A087B451_9BIFI|nr:hypothetical protein [Bifidobacterium cuniculi]KFI65801.1 Cd efflux system component [Bifidobacterium cuniculi]